MKKNSETQTDKPKYGKVKKEDHEKFFQRVAPKDIDPKANLAENMAEVEKLGGLFELIDPIETIYGPIGAFPMVPDAFPLHPSMCYFGQRRTGKSYTARDVASKIFRDIPFGIVLTMTIENGFWQVIFSYFVFFDLFLATCSKEIRGERFEDRLDAGIIGKTRKIDSQMEERSPKRMRRRS